MSGQWPVGEKESAPDNFVLPEPVRIPFPIKIKLLTEKQVFAAHQQTTDKRFPTVRMYLEELTKCLNLELEKQDE